MKTKEMAKKNLVYFILAFVVGIYYLMDKIIHIYYYDLTSGMPLNENIALFTNDLLLGSRTGESINGFPKLFLLTGAGLWLVFLCTNMVVMLKRMRAGLKFLILYCVVFAAYLILTMTWIIIEIGFGDIEYFNLLFFSRALSLTIFVILSLGYVKLLKMA